MSAAAELGLALLGERPGAFLGVVAGEHGPAVGVLVIERLLFGHAVGLVQRAQDRLDGEGSVLADRRGDLLGLGECLAVGHDVTDQPDVGRLPCGDVFAGQQDLRGVRVGDLTAQAHGGATHRVEAPAGLGHAEAGALARDTDVGRLEDLGAAGDGDPLDRGDDGFGWPVAAQQRLPVDVGIGPDRAFMSISVSASSASPESPGDRRPSRSCRPRR